jgi:4-amino-4-deoxy-L-arabinose transferase-like glycosyltransferase
MSSPTAAARRALLVATLGACLAATLPRLTSLGMFGDGVFYAALARNLAGGLGSAWALFLTPARPLFEHPPGAMWMLAGLYAVFGDSYLVEGLASEAAGLVLVGLVVALWRALGLERFAGAWLAVLVLIAIPVVTWAFGQNLLDVYQAVLTTAAVVVAVMAGSTPSGGRALALGAAAGVLVAAAVLVKGPTALFPLAVPPLALVLRTPARPRGLLVAGLGMVAIVALVFAALWSHAPARAYLAEYLRVQVVRSLRGERAVVDSRWFILFAIAKEIATPAVALSVGAVLLRGRRRFTPPREALLALGIALAASLPLTVSPKQYLRYALPAFPLFAVALAALAAPLAAWLEERVSDRSRRWLVGGGLALALAGVAGAVVERGQIRDQRAFHEDFTRQPYPFPLWAHVAPCPTSLGTFTLRSSFARFAKVDLADDASAPADFFVTEVSGGCEPPPGCVRVHPAAPFKYVLFDCRGRHPTAP